MRNTSQSTLVEPWLSWHTLRLRDDQGERECHSTLKITKSKPLSLLSLLSLSLSPDRQASTWISLHPKAMRTCRTVAVCTWSSVPPKSSVHPLWSEPTHSVCPNLTLSSLSLSSLSFFSLVSRASSGIYLENTALTRLPGGTEVSEGDRCDIE